MKDLSGNIKYCIIALACVLSMGSCIYDYDVYDQTAETEDSNKALFVLHIMPVNTRGDLSGSVVEKIKSLRVIAISKGKEGEDDVIEINRLVKFDDEASTGFGYAFTWHTTPGHKDFYIIANEESVGNISFESTENLPEDVTKLPNLTALLDYYRATPNEEFRLAPSSSESTTDKNTGESETKSNVAEFKQAINAIYFSPTYNINGGQIFLPYTTCYENVEVKALKDNDMKAVKQTMYLVPVATKFYFRFYNYHENPVEIKNLSIKSIASQNFLLGHVNESDQKKDFDGVKMYWVDWLAKVAEKTHDGQLDNEDVNKQYGWISDYQMPTSNDDYKEAILISTDNVETILVSTDEKEAPLYLGPYYYPESRNYEDGNTTQEQNYLLHLHLHDTEVDSSTSNDFDEELRIGNVKALFRDTCVLIQVTMKNGDVEVYAEMAPWEHEEVSGWADGGSIIP